MRMEVPYQINISTLKVYMSKYYFVTYKVKHIIIVLCKIVTIYKFQI